MHEKPRKPTPWLTFACIALVTAFVGVKMLQDWYPIEALYAGLAVASAAMVLLVWLGRYRSAVGIAVHAMNCYDRSLILTVML